MVSPVHRRVIVLAAIGLVVVAVIGFVQASGNDPGDDPGTTTPLTRAQVSRPIQGVPPVLAGVRRQVNVLDEGGEAAFEKQLRELRGVPVVVNLWASWCGPCRIEMPVFQRQAIKHARTVAFLGINVGDNRENAGAFLERYPVPYPSFEDPDRELLDEFRARGLPTTVFYNAAGEREQVHQGPFRSGRQLADAIERYAGA